MTARAIDAAFFIGELPGMPVLVTGAAAKVREVKHPGALSRHRPDRVTFFAERIAMLTAQREARAAVIELHHMPAVTVVTSFTALTADAAVELTGVYVFVAGRTREILPCETQRPRPVDHRGAVTAHAGNRFMRATQREARVGMFFRGKQRRRKSIHDMACSTVPGVFTIVELSGMEILVTGGAFRHIHGVERSEIPTPVALDTLHCRVPSLQGKIRLRMIEASLRDTQLFPPGWSVTLRAVLPVGTPVMIFMAVRA